MKTGAEILEMLPEEIRGKVDANIGIGFSAGAKELILNDFYRSIYSFLSGAFDWGKHRKVTDSGGNTAY